MRSYASATRAGSQPVPGLGLCRYVLRLPPVTALTTDQIIHDVAPVIQRYLNT